VNYVEHFRWPRPHIRRLHLLRRRGEPTFYAFDCLMLNGRDLRQLPLVERKEILLVIVKDHSRILFARHVERKGA
jgi:bifunctional non-homologous end joining protein LigD